MWEDCSVTTYSHGKGFTWRAKGTLLEGLRKRTGEVSVSFNVRFGRTPPEPERRLQRMQMRAASMTERFGPMSQQAKEMAAVRATGAREWTAPQLHRAAQYVEESLAPRVSGMMRAGARRIEPDRPQSHRMRNMLIGIFAVAGIAAVGGMLLTRWNAMHGMGEGDVVEPEQLEDMPAPHES